MEQMTKMKEYNVATGEIPTMLCLAFYKAQVASLRSHLSNSSQSVSMAHTTVL